MSCYPGTGKRASKPRSQRRHEIPQTDGAATRPSPSAALRARERAECFRFGKRQIPHQHSVFRGGPSSVPTGFQEGSSSGEKHSYSSPLACWTITRHARFAPRSSISTRTRDSSVDLRVAQRVVGYRSRVAYVTDAGQGDTERDTVLGLHQVLRCHFGVIFDDFARRDDTNPSNLFLADGAPPGWTRAPSAEPGSNRAWRNVSCRFRACGRSCRRASGPARPRCTRRRRPQEPRPSFENVMRAIEAFPGETRRQDTRFGRSAEVQTLHHPAGCRLRKLSET